MRPCAPQPPGRARRPTATGGTLERLASTFDALEYLLQDLQRVRDRARPDGRPFVTLAYAQSVDGSIARERGERYTLSGPDSLRLTHMLRSCHDAILVGVGTVLADDPELGVRMIEGRAPQPVVVDSQLRTPLSSRLLGRAGRRPWIATTGATAAPMPSGPPIGPPVMATAITPPPRPPSTRQRRATGRAGARRSRRGAAG